MAGTSASPPRSSFVYPLGPIVYGGPILWPAAQSARSCPSYVELCQDLPDELSLFAGLIPSPEDMQPLVAIVVGWFGPLDGAEAALAPVRALPPVVDIAGPIPYVASSPCSRRRAPRDPPLLEVGLLQRFPEPALAAIADAYDRAPTPLSVELFFHQHGAASKSASRTQRFHRSPSWDFDASRSGSNRSRRKRAIEWARSVWNEIAPSSTGVYVNHLDDDDTSRVAQAYGPNYERLVSLKQKYDPDNFFRLNKNIAVT